MAGRVMSNATRYGLSFDSISSSGKSRAMFKEFTGFLKQYGVIGLALAVVIGGKANALVNSLVNDLLMPAIFQPALHAAGVNKIEALEFHGIFYGKVIGALLEFILVSFVVFVIAKKILKDESIIKK